MSGKTDFVVNFPLLGPMQRWTLDSTADEIFSGTARGASKTFGAVGKRLFFLLTRRYFYSLYFRQRFADLKGTVFPVVHKWLDNYFHEVSHYFNVVEGKNPRVECSLTGSSITFAAAETIGDTEKVQGGNFHDLLVDEAQSVSPEILQRIPAVIRSVEGDYRPQMEYLANPGGHGRGWLFRRFIAPARAVAPRGNVSHDPWKHPLTGEEFELDNHWKFQRDGKQFEVILAHTWMNPVLNYKEYLGGLASSMAGSPTLIKQWLENDWDVVAGEFFPRIHESVRTIFSTDRERVLCGIDNGWRKTAAVWVRVDEYGNYHVFDEEMYLEVDIVDKAQLIKCRHPETSLFIIDPTSNMRQEASGTRTIRKIYQDEGLNPLIICRSNNRKSGWEALRNGMGSNGLSIDPVCIMLQDSLSGLITKENDSQDCEKNDGMTGTRDGDHLADALRYVYVNGFYTGDVEIIPEYTEAQKRALWRARQF